MKKYLNYLINKYSDVSYLDADDFKQILELTLLEQKGKYNKDKCSVEESVWLKTKFRQNIIDELRKASFKTRSTQRFKAKLSALPDGLSNREKAEILEMDLSDFFRALRDDQWSNLKSLEDEEYYIDRHDLSDIETHIDLKKILKTIKNLPERERFVLSGFYLGEETLYSLAEKLKVSPGRASQIRKKAIDLIKTELCL